MNRYASRYNHRDSNEPAIISTLKRMGVRCFKGGDLDWTVHFPHERWMTPLEIKTPTGRLTKRQQEFVSYCVEAGLPVLILRSADEAIEAVMQRAVKFVKEKKDGVQHYGPSTETNGQSDRRDHHMAPEQTDQ